MTDLIPRISTGMPDLDNLIGGGIPVGYITSLVEDGADGWFTANFSHLASTRINGSPMAFPKAITSLQDGVWFDTPQVILWVWPPALPLRWEYDAPAAHAMMQSLIRQGHTVMVVCSSEQSRVGSLKYDSVLRLGYLNGEVKVLKSVVSATMYHTLRVGPPAEPTAPAEPPQTILEWQKTINAWAERKGWNTPDTKTFGDTCALLHTEVSEAYEEYWGGHEVTEIYEHPDKPGKLEGVPVELADVVIRILHFCGQAGIDLQDVMARKHAYNETREYRHGGKRT